MSNKIGRRQFLRLSAMAAAGATAVACQPQTVVVKETVEVEKEVEKEVTRVVEKEVEKEVTKVVEKEVTKVVEKEIELKGISDKQAPALGEMVKSGTLPPLDERLPRNPKVLIKSRNEVPQGDVDLEIGKHGGTIRSVQSQPANFPDMNVSNNEPLLHAPGILAGASGGNVIESFEVLDGGLTFVLRLRVGLKWSDGMPVTTEDIQFVYEDILLNEELTSSFPVFMRSRNSADGEPLTIEIVDNYTFTIHFSEPYEGFQAFLSQIMWKGYTDFLLPKHVLTQFHADYTPLAKLEPLLKEASLPAGEWWSLFNSKRVLRNQVSRPQAVGFPVLNPWYIVTAGQTASTYDRNPYYFKVDEAGQQLPYVDGIFSAVVADVEMSQLKVIAGEVDWLQGDATLDNLALYKENAEKAGYRVVLLNMHIAPTNVSLNLTYDDPVWREVVRDVRFRKALSHAIDRPTIIDAIYYGFAEMPNAVPNEYDPELANQLLDEMGMTERDPDGFRLAPSGQPFDIPFEVSLDASDIVPVTEMIVEYYGDVGIRASLKVIERALRVQRSAANELQARTCWHHGPELWWGAYWDYLPQVGQWGIQWGNWLDSNGERGEEPPPEVKQFAALVNRSIVVAGEQREQAITEFRQMMYDNVWIIVTAERVKNPLIASKALRNVPESGFAIAANFALEQVYFE